MWLMPISLAIYPSRTVTDPDGVEWTIAIARGNQWAGWGWLNFLEESWITDIAPVHLPLYLLALPSVATRWSSYYLRRRTDWQVTVRRGSHDNGQAARDALIAEVHPSREAAAERGERLAGVIGQGEISQLLPA